MKGFYNPFILFFIDLFKRPKFKAMIKLLDECQAGEHSDRGCGTVGTFAEMLNEISNLK